MSNFLRILNFMLIFAMWIGWSSYQPTRGKSIAPSTFLMIDNIKKIDEMTKRKTIEDVKHDFTDKWGGLYDYSQIVEYNGNKQKLPIVCKEHGVFMMSTNDHLRGHGCPKCRDKRTSERCRFTFQEFVERAKALFNNKYGYELINEDNYKGLDVEVPIVCPIHGVFMQKPKNHLSGRGCYKCGKESTASKQRYTRDELVELFNKEFQGKYDYSLFKNEDYKRKKDKIKVICRKHGVFEVSVDNHLYRHSGCPKCKHSLGEERISNFLNEHKIEYREQYRLNNEYLLCTNKTLIVDFFLPSKNVIIEYNGIQHYEQSPLFDERDLQEQQERDNAVRQYCKDHKIKLIEIPYTKLNEIDEILSQKLKV